MMKQSNCFLLTEIALKETIKALAVAGLVLAHLVHGVVDGVVTQLLSALGDGKLAVAGAELCFGTHGYVLLGAGGKNLPQKLCKLGGVLSFLEGVAAEGLCYLGITLALCLEAHGKVHAYLAAFAGKVVAKSLDYFFIKTLGYAYAVLVGIDFLYTLFDFLEGVYAAYGAYFRCGLALDDFATDGATVLFHNRVCRLCVKSVCVCAVCCP